MTSSHEVQLEVYPFCKNLLHNKISRKCLYLFWIYQRRIHNDTDGCKYKEEVRKRNETLGIVYMLIRRFYMSFPRGRFLKFLLFCERLIIKRFSCFVMFPNPVPNIRFWLTLNLKNRLVRNQLNLPRETGTILFDWNKVSNQTEAFHLRFDRKCNSKFRSDRLESGLRSNCAVKIRLH